MDATPGATPEKRVLAASGDTDNRHRLPTHAAGGPQVSPGASLPGGVAVRGACPRRRWAPCLGGWGVVPPRRVETPPYKVVLGVRLLILCARRGFVPCLDQSHSKNDFVWGRLHTAARPPQTGCPASTGTGAADGHPIGQARPRGCLDHSVPSARRGACVPPRKLHGGGPIIPRRR